MALKQCRECGGEVSTSALRCPHCGADLKPGATRAGCLVFLLFAGPVVAFIWWAAM